MALPLIRAIRAALLAALAAGLVAGALAGCGGADERADGTPRFSEAELRFSGNDELWGFTLGRAISDFEDRALSRSTVEDAASSLERYYAARGFPYAVVEGRLEARRGGEPVAAFAIYEGPRPPVGTVRIAGNRALRTEALEESVGLYEDSFLFPSYLVQERLDDDAERLRDVYAQRGYIEARVTPRVRFRGDPPVASVTYAIEEGRRFTVSAVTVTGSAVFPPALLAAAAGVTVGADFYPRRALEAREGIERFLRDAGHAFATVTADVEIDRAAATGTIRAHIREGRPQLFGRTFVRGNVRTKGSIVERELDARPGRPFGQDKLRRAEKRLYELGLFERVSLDVEPSPEAPDTTDVRIEVREREYGAVRLGGGYGSYDGVRGQAQASYANLLGRGIQVDARGLVSQRGFLVNAGLRDPFILGTRLRFDLDAYYEDRDVRVFDIFRRGGTAFLSYPLFHDLFKGLRVAQGLRFERSAVTDLQSGALVEDSSIFLFSTISRISLDRRDDQIDPRSGVYGEVAFEEAGIFGVGDADHSRLTGIAAGYATPADWLTLALALRGGIIYDHEGTPIPIQERFFLGGETTLRGFEQNEVGEPDGGNVFVLGSLEARLRLYGPFSIAPFIDAGAVYDRYRQFTWQTLRPTPGVGLRAVTPIGPLRFDVGFKTDKNEGEDLYEMQFSVGYPF